MCFSPKLYDHSGMRIFNMPCQKSVRRKNKQKMSKNMNRSVDQNLHTNSPKNEFINPMSVKIVGKKRSEMEPL